MGIREPIKMAMIFEIENLRAGKNNIRLFRGEKIVDATVSYLHPSANFDDWERNTTGDPAETVSLSTINDFIKSGIYVLVEIKVEVIQPAMEDILANGAPKNSMPLRKLPERIYDQENKVWIDIPERPVVFIHEWSIVGTGHSEPIYLSGKEKWEPGEIPMPTSQPLAVHLNVEKQIGIQFIDKGKIRLYLYIVRTEEYNRYIDEVSGDVDVDIEVSGV